MKRVQGQASKLPTCKGIRGNGKLKGGVAVVIALAGQVIFQGGQQAVSEVVDGALGGLGGNLEMLSQPGCVGETPVASLVVKPDKTLQIKLVAHEPLPHCAITSKNKVHVYVLKTGASNR
jgi:hypothetical protein